MSNEQILQACPRCERENSAGNTFCIHCGAPLVGSPPVESGRQGQDTSLVEEPLRDMQRVLLQLSNRVAALERQARDSEAQTPPAQTAARSISTASGQAVEPPISSARAAGPGGTASVAAVSAASVPDGGDRPPTIPFGGIRIDWELVIGLNWLAIIGAVALALGVGFFLRLAFENDWIGETGRIILGLVVGLLLLAIAEYAQRHYPVWAQAVTGGGIAILYFSIYAAFGFYELIDPLPAFLFLALVVLLSGLLALRHESLVIALLGILGAFVTPVLLGQDLHDARLLLAYILVVDIGILGVSTFRNWRWFNLIGLLGSYGLFALWLEQIPAGDLLLAQVGLSGIFLVFVGATTLFHVIWRRAPGRFDMALMTLNAMAFYGNTFGLLWETYEIWFGLITLALSLFYGLVGYAAKRRPGAPPEVVLFSLAIALIFLTVAVPLQLTGTWITVAWAAEGAVLVWVGFVLRSWPTRAFALGVFAITSFRLLVLDTPVETVGFQLLLNERFPTFTVAIAAFYIAAFLYRRQRNRLKEWEVNVALLLVGVANVFTLWVLSAEVISYFDSRALASIRPGVPLGRQDADNGILLSLSVLWATYAVGLMAVALGRHSRILRWLGLGLLSMVVLKLMFVDTFNVYLNPRTFILFLNVHFLTFLLVLAVVLFAAYLYWRQRQELLWEERFIFPALLVAANVVAVWVLSAEVFRFFDSRELVVRMDFTSAKHLLLTVLWTVYAIGIIAVGIARQFRAVRLAGIALLGIPVLKLFVFDVFLLESGYRVAAFVTLGVLLLCTGLAYQRYNSAIRGFLFGTSAQ